MLSLLDGTTALHAGHGVAPLDVRLAVAMLAGLLATFAVTAVMQLQSYGYVPAYVAAGAVWGRDPEAVPRSAAHAAHLTAGMLAGLLFEVLVLVFESVRGLASVDPVAVGVTSLSELLALVLVVGFLYGFFSWVVFPRFGGAAYEAHAETVFQQWAISAGAYGALLFVAVNLLYTVLPV